MFNSWGLVNACGTYASFYMQTLLPKTDVLLFNLVGSTQSALVLLLSAPVGRFLDANHSFHLILIGSIFVVVGSFVLSTVNGAAKYGQGTYILVWLCQGFITGLGMACFFVTSSQVVATWFKRKRGLAIGIVASGASIAGLVYPMMNRMLTEKVGFNNAQRYVSTVTACTCLMALFAARPSPDHPWRIDVRWSKFRTYFDPTAYGNASYNWFTVGVCWLFFGFYVVFFNLEEWAVATGVGSRGVATPTTKTLSGALQTYLLLSIMNVCSTFGRLGSAYLGDKFGALRVHACVTFIAAMLILTCWTTAKTVSAAMGFVVVFGIFSGAVIGLPPASVAHILGPDHINKLGQWTGILYSSSAIFALTGPVIAGHLITAYNRNFLTVQLWSGFCLLFSSGCMAMSILKLKTSHQYMDEVDK
ncbi:MFS general substrate transporter [Piedraia hortae CBS 480.64]|uniref:MFS general substrate transporter n=1 Tax=Piedraia hortae CBS 480.64 TaxID=1314780 RepID=A0A6A7C751_9PEZI|nr:MFS general substrate transporter [Piedraia hortae CBS 480.64]